MSNNVCFAHLAHGDGSSRVDFTPQRVPCGASDNVADVFNCCSPGDTCLEGNICHFVHPEPGSTGYYLAGCTDPNFKDPKCMQHCFDQWLPDITYNYTSSSWACCTSNPDAGVHCDQPSGDTWQAPPPQELKEVASVPTSATVSGYRPSITINASSMSSAIATSSATTTTAAAASSARLSPSTEAGIISAVVIIVLLALAALVFFLLHHRRQRNQLSRDMVFVPPLEKPMPPSTDVFAPDALCKDRAAATPAPEYASDVAEVPNHLPRQEMPGRPIAEMPSTPRQYEQSIIYEPRTYAS